MLIKMFTFLSKNQGDKHTDFHVYLRLNSHDQNTLFLPRNQTTTTWYLEFKQLTLLQYITFQ